MKKAVYYILLAVFIGVFLFAAYQIGSYMLEKHKSDEVLKDAGNYVYIPDLSSDEEPEQEGEPEQVYVDFAALEGVNSDIVAWLYGADTGLNYPIVQAEDNDYYLYRLLDGTWNKNGTIFMDYVNRSDFSDQNTLVYGHHMKSGAMFGALVQYKKQEFYDAHPYLYLYTPQQSYRLDLIAGSVVDYDDAVYSTVLSADTVSALVRSSRFESRTPVPEDLSSAHLVTLSTCSYEFEDARFVVVGVLTPIDPVAAPPEAANNVPCGRA